MRLFFSFILIVGLSAQAADLYLDGLNGDDSNDGTSWAQAEKTFSEVLANVSDGDTINWTNDISETVTINRDESPSSGITIRGYGMPVLDTTGATSVISIHDDKVTLRDFTVDGNADSGETNQHGIYIGGYLDPAIECVITNVHVQNAQIAFNGHGTVGSIAHHVDIIDSSTDGVQKHVNIWGTTSGTGWTVRGNYFRHLRGWNWAQDVDGIRLNSGANHLIELNYIEGPTSTNETEILVDNYHIDGFQVFTSSGQDPLVDTVVRSNFITSFHTGFQFTTSDSSGDGLQIVYNVFAHGFPIHWTSPIRPNGNGVWSMSDAVDVVVTNNTVIDWYIAGAFLDFTALEHKNNLYSESGTSSGEKGYALTGTTPTGGNDYNLTYSGVSDDAGGNDVNVNALLSDDTDILGPDGLIWTGDDGLRLLAGSPAIGAAEDGGDIGAYARTGNVIATTLNVTGSITVGQ